MHGRVTGFIDECPLSTHLISVKRRTLTQKLSICLCVLAAGVLLYEAKTPGAGGGVLANPGEVKGESASTHLRTRLSGRTRKPVL
jgi:hypothetical protein